MAGKETSKKLKDLVVPELEDAKGTAHLPFEANWTEEQLAILRKYYPTVSTPKVAEVLGKTKGAVKYAAEKLGLKKGAETE